MTGRILAIAAGLVLPPIGVILFAVGAQDSLRSAFSYGGGQASSGWVPMLIGALLVAAAVVAARWSGIGLAIAGGFGVLFGLIQFAFPISFTSFNFGLWFVSILPLPREGVEALITFIYVGGPLLVGALLLGAGLGIGRGGVRVLWSIIAVGAVIVGVPLAIAGQGLLTTTMRIMQSNLFSTPVLLLAAVLLAAAAYSSRGGGLALLVSGGVVAALGLLGVAVPTLFAGPSAVLRLSPELSYVFSFGLPLLFGVILAAAGAAGLLAGRRTADAVEPDLT